MTTDNNDFSETGRADARWDALRDDRGEEDDFWGDQADWSTAAIPVVARDAASDEIPAGSSGAGSGHGAGHDVDRAAVGRRHREVTPPVLPTDDTPTAPIWDDRWAPAQTPASRGVDPRIFRLAAVAVIVTLLVPVVAGFRSRGADDLVTLATAESAAQVTVAAGAIEDEAASTAAESSASSDGVDTGTVAASDASAPTSAAETTAAAESSTSEESTDATSKIATTDTEAVSVGTESAVATEQLCPVDYEVRAGDFWLRLADGAGVELAELLDANAATVNTPLHPGRSICLPAGSTTPPPPAAAANSGSSGGSGGSSAGSSGGSSSGAAGNSQPTPTSPPAATTPPTTAAPTTTAAPAPPPPAPVQVEQIIRRVWPDDLEEKALKIAWRESNYKANVKNYCCYGLFQIYWSVHQSWLSGIGITSASQLYDAETNTRAAYTLYQRSGGWGPWGG
jgi:LysM repeat protein